MALRFRKSFKLAPGVRLYVSKSGLSTSIGPRGATVSFGRRGVAANVGIPGSGLSIRQQLTSSPNSQSRQRTRLAAAPPPKVDVTITVGVDDEGVITFRDSVGNDVPDSVIVATKKQQGAAINALIEEKCREINDQIEALGRMHVETPAPEVPRYVGLRFDSKRPKEPPLEIPGLMAKIFKSRAAAIERRNVDRKSAYGQEVAAWEQQRDEHDAAEVARRKRIEHDLHNDVEVMSEFLEERLQEIEWPRETLVSADIADGGRTVYLDVDLPEIEDLPRATASVPQRGFKLTVKQLSETKLRHAYMSHVHGIGFRIIGETFAALPVANEVVLSAYSQRPEKSTGHVVDQYLYSVRVKREEWLEVNFEGLEDLDVIQSLARFELRRKMTKTGVFTPIDPFEQASLPADGTA